MRLGDEFRFLGKMIEYEQAFYRIEVARDGAFVKLQKAENVVLGKVKVPDTISQFSAFGPNGHFTRKPVKGELTLPVGSYAMQDWTIKRKDKAGESWELRGNRDKEAASFELAAGEPALRYQWNAPIVLSPHNPGIVFIANQYVWRSLSRGAQGTFQKISPDLTKANKEKIALSRKTNLQWATI